ncbi:endolytic transglycosylase MltG [Beijerinckiaceae bacterium]|nr:endolytic transglycosylase MltG [Beijerinckiaceae bacterium]
MPSKPNEDDAAEGLDQNRAAPTRRGGRFAGQRVTPQSPKEALQPDAAPPPPPIPPSRRRPTLSALSGFLSFLLILAVAGVFGIVWSQQRMRAPGPLTTNKVLYIAPGTEVPDIIAELDREGVIDNAFALNLALLLEGNRSKVKAGEYMFKQNASLRDVIDTLVNGKQVLHAITIPEGLTSEQIVERLRESDVLQGDLADLPKEGSLLPETYKVARGTLRADLVKKMQDDQKRVVDQIWSRRTNGLPLRSPYDLVTLASIVEKETGKADERPRVASVFLNRLQKRMRLQSDPTIVYGLVGGKGSLGRGLSRAEVDKATPYNTYTNEGLPPGPIANPGRAALEAVANPSRTQDLYFVADGTGGHIFSETLDQHSRNVQRWRQIEKDTKEKQEQEQAAPEVDTTIPQGVPPAPPPSGERKSELGTGSSIYGSLPSSFGTTTANLPPSMLPYASAVTAINEVMPTTKNAQANKARGKTAQKVSAFTWGPGLDELGITVQAPKPTSAAAVLDGPVGQSDAEDGPAGRDMTFPVSTDRLAEQKSRAAGLSQNSDDLADRSDEAGTSPAPQPQNAEAAVHRARAFDASEGTPLDPLRNKTYDLNYPKTVPAIR